MGEPKREGMGDLQTFLVMAVVFGGLNWIRSGPLVGAAAVAAIALVLLISREIRRRRSG